MVYSFLVYGPCSPAAKVDVVIFEVPSSRFEKPVRFSGRECIRAVMDQSFRFLSLEIFGNSRVLLYIFIWLDFSTTRRPPINAYE